MLKFLIKNAVRSILKDKYQFFLNFVGLTLGFAAYLFIATYFIQELSFDRFHTKSDRIFRIVTSVKMGETGNMISNSEIPIANALKTEVPEVEDATRLYYRSNVVVKVRENKYIEKRFWYADANFFQLFDFDLLKGDKNQALTQPNSVVVTPDFSKRYFGDIDPIGKTIQLNNGNELYEITGVLEELPANSHLDFDMLGSFSTIGFSADFGIHQWGNFRDMYTYVLLKENVDLPLMQEKLQDLTLKYYVDVMESIGMSYDSFIEKGNYVFHNLQPIDQIHLDPDYQDEAIIHGNKQLLFALGLVGLFIIFIACFNFINLSTARASIRAKEIGVKKIIGSGKLRIIIQLLTETFIQCSCAFVAALIMIFMTRPLFNNFSGLDIQFYQFFSFESFLSMLVTFVLVIILAGLFPSTVIARFNPIETLKGKFTGWKKNSVQRSILVSFQFTIFIVMVCCTILVHKQLKYLHHQNPGFNKENVLVIKNTEKLGRGKRTFKQELEKNPEVIGSSYSSNLPSIFSGESNPFSKSDKKNQIFLKRLECDADFLSTLKINLIDGRNFSPDQHNESANAIINTAAAKAFGWTDSNDKILYDYNDQGKYFNVVGIVEDFHITSLRESIEPMIIRYQEDGNYLSIRIRPGSSDVLVNAAEKIWKKLNDQAPFEYSFLDVAFDNQYRQEERFGKLVSLFSIMSIVIACLGLLGLTSFTLSRKQKEIGVRKVNGARVSQVLTSLNRDFVKWIGVSFIIATPIAWYLATRWLENFAYKTEVSWWIFVLAGSLALAIALLTVSWQSWKAATRNPVEALRYE